ncbi:hypothetical protein AYK26_00710 [Euryarchaeota archaeon SM23-78]|nr:MAG: hypothetical protein AYK26_00710 [Euryarchaeota archaeon SM23-78]
MQRYKLVRIFLLTTTLLINTPLFSQCFDLIPNKSADEDRILKLLVVADSGYRVEVVNWRKEISRIISTMSMLLSVQKTGLSLEITRYAHWQRETESDKGFLSVLIELEKDFPRDKNQGVDIIMGLTSHGLQEAQACADSQKGYIVLSNKTLVSPSDRPILLVPVLIHELGHIFGCNDVDGKDSVMKRAITLIKGQPTPVLYDQKSLEKIRVNKWRKFPSKVNWREYLN